MTVKGLREKSPLRLAIEGVLVGTFLAVIIVHGDFSTALEVGIFIGIFCGLVGLVYRGVRRLRS